MSQSDHQSLLIQIANLRTYVQKLETRLNNLIETASICWGALFGYGAKQLLNVFGSELIGDAAMGLTFMMVYLGFRYVYRL